MDKYEDVLLDVVNIISDLHGSEAAPRAIAEDSRLLIDDQLDSLKLMALVSAIDERYGVDLLDEKRAYGNLESPRSIALAIIRKDRRRSMF